MFKSLRGLMAILLILALVFPANAAVSTTCPHNNNNPGVGAVVKESVFDMHSTAKYSVGTRKSLGDGRMYRYAHFGEDTATGLLVSQDVSESTSLSGSGAFVVVASASAQTTTDGLINDKFIEITASSITANQYAGGYLVINDSTGEGYVYRIKSNTATDDPASGNFRVELKDKLQLAVGIATELGILGDKYANLESAIGDGSDEILAGVTVSAMDISEASYGWVQTQGPCIVAYDAVAAITLGGEITMSDSQAGSVQLKDAETEWTVGYAIDASDGDNDMHGLVMLQLE